MSSEGSSSYGLQKTGLLLTIGSISFVFLGLFCLLGGIESLWEVSNPSAPIFLSWPFSIAYFWPLCIPLGTYLVIARWAGYKLFRHA